MRWPPVRDIRAKVDDGQEDLVQAVIAGVFTVVGTLIGSFTAHHLQRRTAERISDTARADRRRQELADAVASFATVASELSRAEFDRGKNRLRGITEPSREEARQESYRLRTKSNTALNLLRLLADPRHDADLIKAADDVIPLLMNISVDTMSEHEMRTQSEKAQFAVKRVIEIASAKLRDDHS